MADSRIAQAIPQALHKGDANAVGYLQSIENAIKAVSTTANNAASSSDITALDSRITVLETGGDEVTTYTSPPQTITATTPITLAHGLGAAPTKFSSYLVCQITDLGYAVNDRVAVSSNVFFYTPPVGGAVAVVIYLLGHTVSADVTNLTIAFCDGYTAGPSQYYIARKDAVSVGFITDANWELVVSVDL